MRIIISGALGHMGRVLAQQAAEQHIEIIAGVDRVASNDLSFPVFDQWQNVPTDADAVIDFSVPSALPSLLDFLTHSKMPAVLATTGYSEKDLSDIREASSTVAIFQSANMSIGVALLCKLAKQAAATLGKDYDIEIVEAHHRRKVDAPSGTALMLYDALRQGFEGEPHPVCGRSGKDAKRMPDEIGFHSLRGGTVAGEHEIYFLGNQERIKLCHSAESRSVFAVGALRAAGFIAHQAPGLYHMDDMLSV